VVVTFLALLELIRLKQLIALQHEAFGEIYLQRIAPVDAEPVAAAAPAGAANPLPAEPS